MVIRSGKWEGSKTLRCVSGPAFVHSEERAARRESSRRFLDRHRLILDYYGNVIHSTSESRRNVAERSFHNLVEI